MSSMFSHSTIKSINLGDITNVGKLGSIFLQCPNLESVTMMGCPADDLVSINMFNLVITNGVLYYDSRYDYSKIIAELPSTWTAVPITV